MKKDFKPYEVGSVFNKLKVSQKNYPLLYEVKIKFPYRLNAMAIDPSKIAMNENMVYKPGEIVFSLKEYRKVRVKVIEKGCVIKTNLFRKSLIRHAYYLMKNALNFANGFEIEVEGAPPKHVGFGSSSNLISSVAVAINEIYGCPIDKKDLVRYLAQNHGEEIKDDPSFLSPVQCIGGSAAAGLYGGGILVISGQSRVITSGEIPSKYRVVVGIPENFSEPDSKEALDSEIKNFSNFINCGDKYRDRIAYRVLHELLPAVIEKDMKCIGDVIFDYRFNMGSIENCSFLYPEINSLSKKLRNLKESNMVDIISLSSVGPAFFAITKNPGDCVRLFSEAGLKTNVYKLENDSYKVLKKKSAEFAFWNSNKKKIFFSQKKPCEFVNNCLSKMSGSSGKKLIDVGSGGGRNAILSCKFGFDTFCVEPNPLMIKESKKSLSKFYDNADERVIEGKMDKIPFEESVFDVVISSGVLHQSKSYFELKRALKEIYRILNIDGKAIINIFSNMYLSDDLKKCSHNLYLTREGLYMYLISESDFLHLCRQSGFIITKNKRHERKEVGTGKRSILRVELKK